MVTSFARVDVPLVRSACSSVDTSLCIGNRDTLSVASFCYTDFKLGAMVNSKVNTNGHVLRSRGCSALPFGVLLCRRGDVHWKRRQVPC